jgi:Ca-activated chloride channel family protein
MVLTVPFTRLILAATLSAAPALLATAQERPAFRASVDRVTLSVSVRTARGRHVPNLKASDFALYDSGIRREILDFRSEPTPVSLALLVDFSGSMDVASRRAAARDEVQQVVSRLTPGVDQVGLFVFDKQLRELQAMAPAPGAILAQLDSYERPFGVTSLFDAVAETGRRLAQDGRSRRAVVAVTDGADNASSMTPEAVSEIASRVDVPVYVILVISPYDRAGKSVMDEPRLATVMAGPLAHLARWTGGEIYAGASPVESAKSADDIVTDLRQQYVMAFEPKGAAGWHPLSVETRTRDHVVRARSGYVLASNGNAF